MKWNVAFFLALPRAVSSKADGLRNSRALNTDLYEPGEDVVFFHDAQDDEDFLSGTTWGFYSGSPVLGDTHGFLSEDFQSHRSGQSGFAYTIGELAKGKHIVRLGFAEVYEPNCEVGKRVMNIKVNGQDFATDLDVFRDAGCNTALVIEGEVESDNNQIRISFESSVENPMVSIIEISDEVACPCFDQSLVESDEYTAFVEGNADGVRVFQAQTTDDGPLEFLPRTCAEASEAQAAVCEEVVVAAAARGLDRSIPFPGKGVEEECPCWPDMSVLLPVESHLWFRINGSGDFARLNVGPSFSDYIGYRTEAYDDGDISCYVHGGGKPEVDLQITEEQYNRCYLDITSAVMENPKVSNEKVTCPCFDQAMVESGDYTVSLEGKHGDVNLFLANIGGETVLIPKTCDEASAAQAEVCEEVYDDAAKQALDRMMPFPEEAVADECPCWSGLSPNSPVLAPFSQQDFFRIWESNFVRLNLVGTSGWGLGYRVEVGPLSGRKSCFINSIPGGGVVTDLDVTEAEFNRCFIDIKSAITE